MYQTYFVLLQMFEVSFLMCQKYVCSASATSKNIYIFEGCFIFIHMFADLLSKEVLLNL